MWNYYFINENNILTVINIFIEMWNFSFIFRKNVELLFQSVGNVEFLFYFPSKCGITIKIKLLFTYDSGKCGISTLFSVKMWNYYENYVIIYLCHWEMWNFYFLSVEMWNYYFINKM